MLKLPSLDSARRVLPSGQQQPSQTADIFAVELQLFNRGPTGFGQTQDVKKVRRPFEVIPPHIFARVEEPDLISGERVRAVPVVVFVGIAACA